MSSIKLGELPLPKFRIVVVVRFMILYTLKQYIHLFLLDVKERAIKCTAFNDFEENVLWIELFSLCLFFKQTTQCKTLSRIKYGCKVKCVNFSDDSVHEIKFFFNERFSKDLTINSVFWKRNEINVNSLRKNTSCIWGT